MRRTALYLILMIIIGGATPIAGRIAVREIPPFTAAWMRFGIAGSLLWLTMRARGQRLPFTRKDLPMLLGLALLCVPVNQAGYLGGLKLSNASHAALFYALNPVIVFWLSLMLGRNSFQPVMLFAAMLAFLGATCVLWPNLSRSTPTGSTSTMLLGDLLLLSAAMSWSMYIVASKKALSVHGPLPTLTAVFLLGALLQTPLALYSLGDLNWRGLTPRGVGGFAFITVVSSFLGYLMTYTVLAQRDATRVMIFVNAQFLMTVLFEWLLYHEPLTIPFMIGSALIFTAISLDFVRFARRA
ncbi:MAG: DMT family transporter [Planctomycetota bacterium]